MQNNTTKLLANFGITTTELTLKDSTVLDSLKVVRYLPNRRCVCHAIWQEKSVYVKLFFGYKSTKYARRDIHGVECLQHANLLTPSVINHSPLMQVEGYAVIFEEIAPAENAEEILLRSNEAAQLILAKQLVKTVAEHHKNKLIQTDMYLKNFLIHQQAVYSIDGDGMRKFDVLSKQKALANLSQLLSKFDVLLLDKHLPLLLNSYTDARGWPEPPNLANIKFTIKLLRYKASKAYADKKVYRQCTDVDVKKKRYGYFAVSSQYSSLALPQAISALDSYFTSENIIKDGNTCTVALSSIDGLNVVIKRYNIKTFWHGVSRAIRQTRASLSWANAHRLMLLGLATAKPIALIETRIWGLKREAYFLSEYVDAPDMKVFFQQTSSSTLRAHAVKQLVELFYRLYMLNISHGDMKATNIKVLADGQPLLIDLDSMQQHRFDFFAKKAHVRDIKRFMQNWKEEPSLYNAFVKGFKVVYADHAPLQAAQILISL
jgi:tRNA A-37 threonylcarbamoyl transferase component Bud32